jgi:1-acyl-sn-glycerol-3-phosphate acyltransferase
VATKGKVPVVPVTILGTGNLMPSGQESKLYPFKGPVRMIVHKPIQGTNAEKLAAEARAAVASAMPPELLT